MTDLDTLLKRPLFGVPQQEKNAFLPPLLNSLTQHHRKFCSSYDKIINVVAKNGKAASGVEDVPYLPITLFKYRSLRSVDASNVRTTVISSGTTGTTKSQIDLDAPSAKMASRALNIILGETVGRHRLPFLVVDSPSALVGKNQLGARASAILGLMPYGRDVTFALGEDFSVNLEVIKGFIARHKGEKILIFGFTFMLWQYLRPFCQEFHPNLSDAVIVHSGGWKKLQDIAVDNARFKSEFLASTHCPRIINFYGMAELPGTVFIENSDGYLYPPSYADVIIRDPITFKPLGPGKVGLIQILSALPLSYPGHSLLTEDMGIIRAVDAGINRYLGNALEIVGRAPRAEMRGCSDVLATTHKQTT